MSTTTRLPSRRRLLDAARTFLVWSGFVLGPLLLNGLIVAGVGNQPGVAFGLRYLLPILAMALLLLALRRRALAATALMFLNIAALEWGNAAQRDVAYQSGLRIIEVLAVDLAVAYVAATRRLWVSTVTAVVVLAADCGVAAAFPARSSDHGGNVTDEMTRDALVVLVALVVGTMIRQRRRGAEALRAQDEARMIQEERLRIARDLHDLVAHSIGVIAIQAGMGRRVIDTQPGEARDALAAIEDTSRDTLAALRRMVGTLRRTDPGPDAAPLDPAPGLADLDGLVARSLDAGVHVDVRWRGDRRPLPTDVDLSAFRIIQEAVTNVVRHAGTGRCDVLLDQRDDDLTVEIVDEGRGGSEGSGYGIEGMRERVGLLDGDFSAGPRPEGGFRVAARIPVPASVP
jgi:signal transduction histidine kinase